MFIPLHDTHAIREVVFAVFFEAAIPPSLVRAVGENLLVPWRHHAPKRTDLRSIVFAPGTIPSFASVAKMPADGLQFEGFKRDGSLSWRVSLQGDMIFINCLEYPGWEQAWPLVREWLGWTLGADPNANVRCRGFGLQYINEFRWQGEIERCTPDQFLKSSDEVPRALLAYRDPRWHLHHGRFDAGIAPYAGETLRRVHIDADRGEISEGKVASPPAKFCETCHRILERGFRRYAKGASTFCSRRW
jgi:uncharacterized protein (TIGR04255 family)